MRKYVLIGLMLLTGFGLFSCSTAVDINASWKEISLAYCLLDQYDTIHYIRISKGYLDPNTSALTIAQRGDSLRYSSLDVKVEQWRNGNRIQTFVCTPVSNVPKDSGLFAYPEQNVYSFSATLDANSEYKLIIKTPLGNVLTSSTKIVQPFRFYLPQLQARATLVPAAQNRIGFFSPVNSTAFKLIARLHYTEGNKNDSRLNYVKKYTDMVIYNFSPLPDDKGGRKLENVVTGRDFLTHLRSNLPIRDSIGRIFSGVEYIVYAAGVDLANYITINKPTQTVNDVRPTFTNINGGFGVFSSRTTSPNIREFMSRPDYPVLYTSDFNSMFREVDGGAGYDSLMVIYPELGFKR